MHALVGLLDISNDVDRRIRATETGPGNTPPCSSAAGDSGAPSAIGHGSSGTIKQKCAQHYWTR
jgi:hypothetical protein